MDTITKIIELMQNRQTTAFKLTQEGVIANGLITQWKQGLQKPSLKNLQKLAEYFDVPISYLIDTPTVSSEKESNLQLTGIDFALWGEVHELTENEKQDILDYIRFKKGKKIKKDDNDD